MAVSLRAAVDMSRYVVALLGAGVAAALTFYVALFTDAFTPKHGVIPCSCLYVPAFQPIAPHLPRVRLLHPARNEPEAPKIVCEDQPDDAGIHETCAAILKPA